MLTDSLERIALNRFDESNDAECLLAIFFDPPCQILKGGGIKFQVSQVRLQREFLQSAAWL